MQIPRQPHLPPAASSDASVRGQSDLANQASKSERRQAFCRHCRSSASLGVLIRSANDLDSFFGVTDDYILGPDHRHVETAGSHRRSCRSEKLKYLQRTGSKHMSTSTQEQA
jgi:hypothetical protein